MAQRSRPPASNDLVTVEERPFNAESPLAVLAEPLTPPPLFYVRNHFDVPRLDPATWRLTVTGQVERPLELSLEEVRALPPRTVTVTLECAGNGRTLMTPTPAGTPWSFGAVSTARFTGTPLRSVLDRAGVRPDTVEALFVGADRGEVEPQRAEPFARSLPLEAARHPDTLLAWAMDGEPLSPDHGSPLRLVVPGWYGVASVKWLIEVALVPRPFAGYFQATKYVYVGEPGTPDGTAVTWMRVRAIIARPADGAKLPFGPVEVAGSAWSGAAPVLRVEVSADGGASWSEAGLGTPEHPHAAAPWRLSWSPPAPGSFTLMARAADRAGNIQPLEPVWNAQGYGNNAVQRVRVRIAGPGASRPVDGSRRPAAGQFLKR